MFGLFALSLSMLMLYGMFISSTNPGPVGDCAVATTGLKADSHMARLFRFHGERHRVPAPMVRLWYPTACEDQGARTSESPFSIGALQLLDQSAIDEDVVNAPIAARARPFPVLVYAPGWSGTRLDNIGLIRVLVSHGFVVASMEYPARMPDMSQTDYHRQVAELQRPFNLSSDAAYHESIMRADLRVRQRAQDAGLVLDALTALNQGKPEGQFKGRLDLNHVGVFGYSFGGAVAAQTCWLDTRFKAAVNIDGWQFANAATEGIKQPYLILSDDAPAPLGRHLSSRDQVKHFSSLLDQEDYRRTIKNMVRHGGIVATVVGTRHESFSDDVLRRPTGLLPGPGMMGARRSLRIAEACVVAFFTEHLEGRGKGVLAESSHYPELRLRVWPSHAQVPHSMADAAMRQ